MQIEMLQAKLHRATVTDANLNYQGSITIDSTLLQKAHLRKGQKVEIANINNGARFSTYIIEGKANSGVICLNGAAARCAEVGDKIIIMAFASYTESELEGYKPQILQLGDNNQILTQTTQL